MISLRSKVRGKPKFKVELKGKGKVEQVELMGKVGGKGEQGEVV